MHCAAPTSPIGAASTASPDRQITVRPEAVSQLTCLAVLGIDARRYLEFVRAHPGLLRNKLGKLVVVRVDDFLAELRRSAGEPVELEAIEVLDEVPEDADAILASLGRRRRVPARGVAASDLGKTRRG